MNDDDDDDDSHMTMVIIFHSLVSLLILPSPVAIMM